MGREEKGGEGGWGAWWMENEQRRRGGHALSCEPHLQQRQ